MKDETEQRKSRETLKRKTNLMRMHCESNILSNGIGQYLTENATLAPGVGTVGWARTTDLLFHRQAL